MTVTMLLFWGGLIAIAIFAIRAFVPRRRDEDGALGILRKRLAAGEIDQNEFEVKKRLLQG